MSKKDFEIRKAVDEDFSYIQEAQLNLAQESEGLKLDTATLSKGVRAVLENSEKGSYYMACDPESQKVAGMLLCVPEWSDWRNATILWIHSVYVSKEYRKQGVYKSLYRYLQKMVEQRDDLKGLRLYVDKSNQSARDVYVKLGMNPDHYELFEWLQSEN